MRGSGLDVRLSRSWRELGGLLASRRLLASISDSPDIPLTPTRLRALDVLEESGGLRIGDLAAAMAIEETTATRLVDRLEMMGVARRGRVAEDGRVTVVALTPKGSELVRSVARRRREFFRDVLAELDPDERAELVRLTAKATAALRARSEVLVAR
jgi:DNA-binding MarR family transcriptional regulator